MECVPELRPWTMFFCLIMQSRGLFKISTSASRPNTWARMSQHQRVPQARPQARDKSILFPSSVVPDAKWSQTLAFCINFVRAPLRPVCVSGQRRLRDVTSLSPRVFVYFWRFQLYQTQQIVRFLRAQQQQKKMLADRFAAKCENTLISDD